MYIIKTSPVYTEQNAEVLQNCKIQNGAILLDTENGKFKYENSKWFAKSSLKDEWIYLGIGANPCYQVENPVIKNQIVFDKLFEKN